MYKSVEKAANQAVFKKSERESNLKKDSQVDPVLKFNPLNFKGITNLQMKKNNTGLPDSLKSGIENLSGFHMDDVKVHYGSEKPEKVQAFAYTQGTEIHVAPGQEKHLPHEAWHVVQQKQGRVKPTKIWNEIRINDDRGLEQEADVMGNRALQGKFENAALENSSISNGVVQRALAKDQNGTEIMDDPVKVEKASTKKKTQHSTSCISWVKASNAKWGAGEADCLTQARNMARNAQNENLLGDYETGDNHFWLYGDKRKEQEMVTAQIKSYVIKHKHNEIACGTIDTEGTYHTHHDKTNVSVQKVGRGKLIDVIEEKKKDIYHYHCADSGYLESQLKYNKNWKADSKSLEYTYYSGKENEELGQVAKTMAELHGETGHHVFNKENFS